MEILTVLKKAMKDNVAVAARLGGDVWINEAGQDDPRPNAVLMLMGGASEWTHQGPSGLYQQTVRVYSRGDTDQDAALLAKDIAAALNGWAGTNYSIVVTQCVLTQSNGDFNAEAKVQRQIDSYTVTWRRA